LNDLSRLNLILEKQAMGEINGKHYRIENANTH